MCTLRATRLWGSCLLLGAMLSGTAAAQKSLFQSETLRLGESPPTTDARAVAAADFNGDGLVDVVGATASLFIPYRRLPDGGFDRNPTPIPIGNSAFELLDLAGDGLPDLVFGAGSLALVVPNFAGEFVPAATSVTPSDGPFADLAVADFNLDGELDLAVAHGFAFPLEFRISILRSTGAGTLLPSISTPAEPFDVGLSVASGDLNQDGKPDVVAVRSQNLVASFLGDGTGQLARAGTVQVNSARQCAIADVDRDGLADAVVISQNPFGGAGAIATLRGSGTGQLAPPVLTPLPATPSDLVVGDWNLEGSVDAAVALSGTQPKLQTLQANNTGTWDLRDEVPIWGLAAQLRAAEMDGDGLVDFVIAARNVSTTGGVPLDSLVQIIYGTAVGFERSAVLVGNVPGTGHHIESADFDGDGHADALAAGSSGLVVFSGDGFGDFIKTSESPTGDLIAAFGIADFDRDGDVDTVVSAANSPSLRLALNSGSGNFSRGPIASLPSSTQFLTLGDFAADGVAEIVCSSVSSDKVTIWSVQQGNVLSPSQTLTVPWTTGARALVADVNGDRDPDVIAGTGPSGEGVLFPGLGPSVATSGAPITFQTLGTLGVPVAAADLDGDFIDDALSVGPIVTVRYGSSGGLVPAVGGVAPALNLLSRAPRAADFDRDGYLECALSTADGRIALVGAGKSKSTRFVGTYFAGRLVQLLDSVAIDADEDGRAELLGASQSLQGIYRLAPIRRGPGQPSPFGTGTPSCFGRVGLFMNSEAKAGNVDFAFTVTQAPREALGTVYVSTQPVAQGVDPFGLGALLHLDFTLPTLMQAELRTDSGGTGSAPMRIPNQPSIIGNKLFAQAVLLERTPAPFECSPSPFGVVTSRGLTFATVP